MIYRIKFEKQEEVKYIGHLDTMRTFTRCIKRTDLPIKFLGGFNPRVQLSFALPLAVGVTSECEFFDVELNGDVEPSHVLEELSKTLPSGFKVRTCQKVEKGKSLMALVKEAVYEITIAMNTDTIGTYVEEIKNGLEKEQVMVIKQGKGGKEELLNIKPYIFDFIVEEINYRMIVLKIHCTAGSVNNVNPNYLVQWVQKCLPEESIESIDVHRSKLILDEI